MARRIRYAKNRPAHPSEKGELSVSYLGVVVLTAGIAVTLIGSGIGGNVASATQSAVCSVTKGDCDTADPKQTTTTANGPKGEGDNSITTMEGTGKNPFATGRAPDPTTRSLTQSADGQETETSPEEEQVKQFLSDRGWTFTNTPYYNEIDRDGNKLFIDPGTAAADRAGLYMEAVGDYYNEVYNVPDPNKKYDPKVIPVYISPSNTTRKDYIQEKTNEEANKTMSEIRTHQEVLKLKKLDSDAPIMTASPYLDLYESAYRDAAKNASGSGSATQQEQAGEHAGREAVAEEIRKNNEKTWGDEWDDAHPKLEKSKNWWCFGMFC